MTIDEARDAITEGEKLGQVMAIVDDQFYTLELDEDDSKPGELLKYNGITVLYYPYMQGKDDLVIQELPFDCGFDDRLME